MDKPDNLFSEIDKHFDGFKFSFHKCLENNLERFRCVKRTCKSFNKSENVIHILKEKHFPEL